MNKQGMIYVACILMVATFFSVSCDDGESSEKLTLSDAVPATVDVTLEGDKGTMQFNLTDVEFDEPTYNAFVDMVGNETIALTIVNDETSVTVNLTSGAMVTEEPASAGEYQIELSGQTLEISFFNEFEDAHINVGGDYSALIDIIENDEFTTESFVADVEVQ